MSFDSARRLADVLLLDHDERGVLAPRGFAEAGGGERSSVQTQFLVAVSGAADVVWLRLRHLQLQRHEVYAALPSGFVPVAELDAGGQVHVPRDECLLCENDLVLRLDEAAGPTGIELDFNVAGDREERLVTLDEIVVGRILRERTPLSGVVHIRSEPVPAERALLRVTLTVENHTPWLDLQASRARVLPSCMLSTHALVWAPGASFIALDDAPPWAQAAAGACHDAGWRSVVLGERDDVLLALPAPPGPHDDDDLHARGGTRGRANGDADDGRGDANAAITTSSIASARRAMHESAGWRAHVGRRVRLRGGRTAIVEQVLRDDDGRLLVAVTVDSFEGAPLGLAHYGQFHIFRIDEVEPVEGQEAIS